jgi:hypothetical protein
MMTELAARVLQARAKSIRPKYQWAPYADAVAALPDENSCVEVDVPEGETRNVIVAGIRGAVFARHRLGIVSEYDSESKTVRIWKKGPRAEARVIRRKPTDHQITEDFEARRTRT